MWLAASPGESSHMVGLLLGRLDEAQKFELWYSVDETSAKGRVKEQKVFTQVKSKWHISAVVFVFFSS